MANRGPFPEPNKQDTQLSAVNNADSNRANLNPPIEAQPIPQHTPGPHDPPLQPNKSELRLYYYQASS